MKKLFATTILLLGITIDLFPQDLSRDYGRITEYELKMKSYSKDPLASAVVLYDVGLSRFVEARELSFDVIFERSTKIKILKESGIEHATFIIPYYQEKGIRELVSNVIAITYNLDNGEVKKTAVNPNDFFDEKINDFWMARKFTMPDVRPGSVIEVKYTVTSPYLMNLRDWEFQWDIPVISSQYVTRMVPFYEYSFILQGSGKFDTQSSLVDKSYPRAIAVPGVANIIEYFDMVYKFGMENVPAYTDNDFITSRNDYIIKIDFQLATVHQFGGTKRTVVSTWPELIKGLQGEENFGKYVSRSGGELKSVFGNVKNSGVTELELFNDIMTYVKTNYKWNGVTSKYATKTPGKFIKDKEGNSAEVNLFAAGLLETAGINASPLLISTRWNGKMKTDYPFLHFFNNVLVAAKIGDEYFIGDATEPLLPNNRIPERCVNDKGLIIKKGEPVWLSLEALNPSSVTTFIEMDITEKDIVATIQKSYTEYDAYSMRTNLEADETTMKKYAENRGYVTDNSSISLTNLTDPDKPLITRFAVSLKTEYIADKIYISPFLNESLSLNPLTQKTRTQPVDFLYPQVRTYASTIKIPEGYDVEILPVYRNVDTPLFKQICTSEKNGNIIQINLLYHFKLGIYEAADYNTLKQHFNDIIKLSQEKIILKKI
jgi:hypothetical protein